MLKNLISDLEKYHKIAIFGFGKEGRSFYDFALKHLPNVSILIVDKNAPSDIDESDKIKLFSGDNYLNGLDEADIIIKSPGISFKNLSISYDSYNFTSTSELFIKHYKKQIIGVTGTKGKSTLVSIIYDLLKKSNKDVVLCGNIGIAAFDILQNIDDETKIVMELSSHQLLNIKQSPHISILTNLFEEHLDYYNSLEEYYGAKFNIFRYQKDDDIAILNLSEPHKELSEDIFKTKKVYNVFNNKLEHKVTFDLKNGYIHNATLQILEKLVELFGIDNDIYLKTIKEFKTLPHRLEFVEELNGISFINDSISTIPEATMEAIKILKNVDTLILGGYDRGVYYGSLVEFLVHSDLKNLLLFSDTGKTIYEILKKEKHSIDVFYMKNLKECVKKAYEVGKFGSIILFSPAASSFNEYKNFMERGDEFKALVREFKS
jgi:UDP-N-acetylmuramoylalanine--D-glutamate ligase